MKRITTFLAAAAAVFCLSPVAVLGAEIDTADDTLILTDEITNENVELLTNEEATELPLNEFDSAGAQSVGEITAFEALDKTEYSFDYKPMLRKVLSQLPDTLTVQTGDETKSINVSWVCDKDYNKILDEYPFVPDMKGYTISEGVELPKLIVRIEDQQPRTVSGFVPITTADRDIPFVNDASSALGDSKIPEEYNVFEKGKLPKVRNQLLTQTCWAHATIGAIEADLIHDGKASTNINLSEMQLAYYLRHSADPKNCRKDTVTQTGENDYLSEGALPSLAVYVMSNLIGAIPDRLAPLSNDPNSYTPGIEDAVSKDKAQLRNAYLINGKDSKAIKKAVMKHGGVSMGFFAATTQETVEKFYNAENAAYYCYDKRAQSNHAVMIVGWDDNFSKKNFNVRPEGDGAWLIRNSWAKPGVDDYCYEEYFWMSYYDTSFPNEEPVVAIDADTDVFDNCYAYDGMPFRGEYYKMYPTDRYAVKYKVAAHESVRGVGFELETANATIDVCAKNLSTGQSVTKTVKTDAAGIYTAVFDKPLEVFDKSTVKVTISGVSDDGKFVGLGYEYPNPQPPYMSYTFKAVVDKGFIYNGDYNDESDLRVKLYTDNSNASYKKVTGVELDKEKATVRVGETLKLKATVIPQDASIKDVTWTSSDKTVAKVNKNGVVTPLKKGSVTITATTVDGNKTAKCKVTVKKQIRVKSITLNRDRKKINVGDTFRLRATIKPDDATVKDVTWTSSRKKVATVSSKGKVTGVKEGEATITARTKDGKKTAKCKVIVKKK